MFSHSTNTAQKSHPTNSSNLFTGTQQNTSLFIQKKSEANVHNTFISQKSNDANEQQANVTTNNVIQRKGTQSNIIQKQEDEDAEVSQNVIDLEPLALVPRRAHQRWRRLNSNQRRIVFLRMVHHYGVHFTMQFVELANAGIHDYHTYYMNRTSQRRNIRYRDDSFSRAGFINAGVTQDTDAFGNVLSIQDEVWIHPDGRMIYVSIANPTNVDTSNREALRLETPDTSLENPEVSPPEAVPPTVGDGDELEIDEEYRRGLENQPPSRTNPERSRSGPRLEGFELTPPNLDDLRLDI